MPKGKNLLFMTLFAREAELFLIELLIAYASNLDGKRMQNDP